MMWKSAEQIADALLYEGYLLYPYRGSAVKNRYRWQFGIVAPRDYNDAGASEPCLMQTQCLIEPGAAPVLNLKIRFLQVEARQVQERAAGVEWQAVDSLYIDGIEHVTWDEAVPRDIVLRDVAVCESATSSSHVFDIAGGRDVDEIRDKSGDVVARVTRERWPISCTVHVALEPIGRFYRVSVRIENVTRYTQNGELDRPGALRRSLIAAHTLLAVQDGAFVSLLDVPNGAEEAAAACENLHTYPVLVGAAPQRGLMLSSPIILHDYPRVAPESPGDLFDGTEIDELLTLRLITLTDEERRQALATDPRAGHVIDRAAGLSTEQLERLHGAIRYLGKPKSMKEPVSLEAWLNPPGSDDEEAVDAAGVPVAKGSRVRLHPAGRADAQDMFLAEQTATVAGVYRDLEDRTHVAVTVDAGGAADIHESNGRYCYFRPEELEVIDSSNAVASAPVQTARVLVAGIGNMFLGDDGFGSAVAQRLAARPVPEGVRVEDFGIRSVHLAYDLLEASYETTILIDAMPRGGAPGTLYVLEPDMTAVAAEPPDAHTLSVEAVLAYLRNIGGRPGRVLVVGCEPLSLSPEMGLSDVVADAVDGAADLVLDLINRVPA